jgi:cell division protein FtsL
MTATQHQRTAPVRQPAQPAPRPRPPLRVVDATELQARARRRRVRAMTIMTFVLVTTGLFGLVASHVVLTQGQFKLQRLQREADLQQARYERLRLEVARLQSPERVVAVAQERLGMVPPAGVRYLSPAGATSAAAPTQAATCRQQDAATATTPWSSLKNQLPNRP